MRLTAVRTTALIGAFAFGATTLSAQTLRDLERVVPTLRLTIGYAF